MSLQVWLPLNGDLHNQGLSDITVTNHGATIDNNGKIGKCYYFNGNNQYLQFSKPLTNLYTGDFSWAIWLKPADSTRGIIFSEYGSTGASNIAFELLANRNIRIYWAGSPDWSTGITLDQDIWSHVAITRHNNILKVYVNGILKTIKSDATLTDKTSSSFIRLGDDYRGGTSVSYMGYMNDARIYDHALSDKEVEEISKGLVLHYKLDQGNTNLLTKYVTPGKNVPGVTTTAGRTNYYGDYGIIIPASENADTYFRLFLNQQLIQGETYTISCYVSGLLSGSYYNFPLFAQGNTSMGVLQLNHNGLCSLTFTMNSSTQNAITAPDGSTVYICFMDDNSRALASGQGQIVLSEFKLEEGGSVTAWCPSEAMPTIYDSSGYNNDGTIVDSLEATTPSPRYSCATKFLGSSSKISNIPTIFDASTLNNEMTCSFWMKNETTDYSENRYIFNHLVEIYIHTSGKIYISWNHASGDLSYNSKNTWAPGQVPTLNEWIFIAFTFKDGVLKVYRNGENKGISDRSETGQFIRGYRGSQMGTNFIGDISDLRLYMTCLSNEQIKELYNTSTTIDILGNAYARELVE